VNLPVDGTEVAIVFAAVFVGALVQGGIGFGMNLVVVPVVALVEPQALPGVAVLLGLPLSVTMFRHEPHHVDWTGLRWIITGRVPGTLLGAWIVTAVSALTLSAIAGGAVLAAVAMSVVGLHARIAPRSCLAAGAASGVMNTTAGIGGPPVALLYQHEDGPVVRSTLAAVFFVGTVLSIATLAVTGSLPWWQVRFGVLLAPAAVLGAVASRPLKPLLDAGWLRPAVLCFAAASAVMTIANALR
jgi:uncharacterized protein